MLRKAKEAEGSSSDYVPDEKEEYDEKRYNDEKKYKKYLNYRRKNAHGELLVNLQTNRFTPLMRAVLYQDLPAVKSLLNIPGIQVNQLQNFDDCSERKKCVAYTALGLATNMAKRKNPTALAIKNALLNHPGINKQLLYNISN